MEVIVFQSSSSGNCSCIKFEQEYLFLDCGINLSKFKKKLLEAEIKDTDVKTFFITHSHTDHISGLYKTLEYYTSITKVYISEDTYNDLIVKKPEFTKFDSLFTFVGDLDTIIHMDNISFTSFLLPHDVTNLGFVFNINNSKISYITDLGFFPEKYYSYIKDCDIYILEANHNLYDLMNCKTRPKKVKERTRSPLGHLSNNDAIYTIMHSTSKLCNWIVFHMSSDTNSKESFERDLISSGYNPFLINYHIASKSETLRVKIDD